MINVMAVNVLGTGLERHVVSWSIFRIRGKSVRSWCDGSWDQSFMVNPLSYFSFQGARCSSVVSVRSWCDGLWDQSFMVNPLSYFSFQGARCSSVVRAFAHGS